MPYKWSTEIPNIKPKKERKEKAHITVMRIKKAVDIHKMCFEISYFLIKEIHCPISRRIIVPMILLLVFVLL